MMSHNIADSFILITPGAMLKSGTEGLISGQPILQTEGQFVACHFSPSEYVPFRKIGRRELKEILRKAADKQDSYEVGHLAIYFCGLRAAYWTSLRVCSALTENDHLSL